MPVDLQGSSPADGSVRTVHVSPDNRLMVAAKGNVRGFFVSRDDKRLFNGTCIATSSTAGAYQAYLKNTSPTRNLFVDIVRVGALNTALWKVVKATGTATGGSTGTITNMNMGSGITAEATLTQNNVGGFTAGNVIAMARHAANSDKDIPFDDTLVLPPQTAIAVEYDTGSSGASEITMRFFFEDSNLDA